MCLNTKQRKPKVATENIVVYKRLMKGGLSAYRFFKYRRGTTHKSEIDEVADYQRIECGLHSYANEKKALADADYEERVVEMIIPKGALYYKGTFNGHFSYASNLLHFPKLKKNGRTSNRTKVR